MAIDLSGLGLGTILGLFAGLILLFVIIGIGIYIYSSLTLMFIAKRTNTRNRGLAWIPIANFYLISKIAKKHWWPMILFICAMIINYLSTNIVLSTISSIFSLTFAIFVLIWWWNICKIRGKPGWWILICLIPIIGWIWIFIMMGILAWEKDKNPASLNNQITGNPTSVQPKPY